MKFSLLKNDKSSYIDEIIMFIIIVFCISIGGLLIKFHPEFGVISRRNSSVFGVVITVLGIMFIPALVYRLFTNE